MSVKEELEEMKKEVHDVQEKSFALEILSEQRKTNKRLFIALVLVICMWFATIGYLVYTLEDIGTINTQEVTDFDTINGDVNNG